MSGVITICRLGGKAQKHVSWDLKTNTGSVMSYVSEIVTGPELLLLTMMNPSLTYLSHLCLESCLGAQVPQSEPHILKDSAAAQKWAN